MIGRPKSITEVQDLVRAADKVHALGAGHSWNKEFFCAGNTTQSINIAMATIEPKR